jgi:hypothetical protein
MRRFLFSFLGMMSLFAGVAGAQTVSGTKVQDTNGTLLASGQWCFGSTCLTVTNGAFSGSVTAGTQIVTVKNAGSTVILSLTSVTISATYNWDGFTVPFGVTFSGNGAPYLACQLAAQYTQSDASNAPWACIQQTGQLIWQKNGGGGSPPIGPGLIAGTGVPSMSAVVPTIFIRTDVAQQYFLTGPNGSTSSTWQLTASGAGTVNPGAGYSVPCYPSASTASLSPCNIASDATGNNLNVPGLTRSVGGVDVASSSINEELANNTASGTTLNKLVCGANVSGTLLAQTCSTTSINWSGVAVGGSTGVTAGNTILARGGAVQLAMDGTSTIGDYVQISTTVAGDGHDAGVTSPLFGAVVGRLVTATVGAGTATVNLYSPGIVGSSSGWPFQPQFSYFAFNATYTGDYGTLTSLVDSSGNAYNGTPGGGAASPTRPTPLTWYSPINFAPTLTQDQWVSIPNAATCGAQTLLFFYTPNTANKVDANGGQYLFGDAGANFVHWINSQQWALGISASGNVPGTIDPMQGNVAFALVNGTAFYYPYGVASSGNTNSLGGIPTLSCAGTAGYIGHNNQAVTSSSGFNGGLHGFIGFSQALSPAQINQAMTYAAQLIRSKGGPEFVRPNVNIKVLYVGDSHMGNFGGNNALFTSRPWYISQVNPALATFANFGVNSQTLVTINGLQTGLPLLTRNTNSSATVLVDAIINDIDSSICANAAACYTTIQTFGTTIAGYPNTKRVYATPIPVAQGSSGQETIREGVLSSVISGEIAGTLNYDAVDDIAEDPIAATQTLPSAYLPAVGSNNVVSCSYSSPNASCVLTSAIPNYQCYPGALWNMTVTGVGQYTGLKVLAACSGSTVTFPAVNCSCTSTGTAIFLGNGKWFSDGTHTTAAMNQEWSTQEAASILAANGALNTCTVIQKQIPYQVPVNVNQASPGLTATVPLLQLFPNWQVCSLSVNVTTAYAGTTTMTMSIGDSGGTSTTYLGATNMQATGSTVAATPTFVSNSGMIQMNFISTGTNINTATAGNVNVDIGVIMRP